MPPSIGILGTAKNTGKTTTTSALLAALGREGRRVGLTSIGYDGEEVDNVTGLPKPRVTVGPGDAVATAQSCVDGSEAPLRPAGDTDVATALGPVRLAVAEGRGRIVLAGPNKGRAVREVIGRMGPLGLDLVIVDGALNRIVPLMETDGVVLTTGAARSIDVPFLAAEVRAIARLFGLPAVPEGAGFPERPGPASFIGEADVQRALGDVVDGAQAIFLPGLVSPGALRSLVERSRKLPWGRRIVLRSAAQLVIAGDAIGAARLVEEAEAEGFSFWLRQSVPLLFVTVNPFYPSFNPEGGQAYSAAVIDPDELEGAVREAVDLPVVDIVREGAGACLDALSRVLPPCR